MKTSYLHVSKLPENIDSSHLHFFKKYQQQSICDIKIKELKNVFVNQQGIVLKRGLLVKGCAFNLIGNKDNTFYYSFWRKTIEQFLVCKYGKSLKHIHLNDEKKYLLIHSAWFNYSFWVNSYLLRLITAIKNIELEGLCLIYPKEWDKIPYVVDSLNYFNLPFVKIPEDHHLFVKHLILPETRSWTNSFDSKTIRNVYDWFSFLGTAQAPTRKVYLTRKKRNLRCIENEDEIIELLKTYGFEIFNFEELSFTQQVQLMKETSHFISIHGAGFSNMVFMQPKTTVFEFINLQYAEKEYTFPFWKLADSLDIYYYYQFGSVKELNNVNLIKNNEYNVNQSYLVNQNIIIDKVKFQCSLNLMLTNRL